MKIILKKILHVCSILFVLGCAGFTVAVLLEGFIEAKVNVFLLIGFFALCTGIGYLFFRFFSSRIHQKSFSIGFYRANYPHIIGDAFVSKRKQEKMLCKALDAMHNDEYEKGIRILEKLQPFAISQDEAFAICFFRALFYDRLGIPRAAIPLYEQALKIKEHSSAASNLASCLQNMGDYDGAIEGYLYATKLDENNPYPYNNLAHLYFTMGEYDESLAYADEALMIKQNMKEAYSVKAYCYAMLDDREAFEKALHQAVAFGANRDEICNYLQNLGANVFM